MTTEMVAEWQNLLAQEREAPYFNELQKHLAAAKQAKTPIYPPKIDRLRALEVTPFNEVKVVILGQDPYHGPNQANGLAFSVHKGIPIPPSLRNIYKELSEDIEGFISPSHGDLSSWAKQGVLLLNTVLSVQAGIAHSHAGFGWEQFTDAIIHTLAQKHHGLVFLLWGSHAQKKAQHIDRSKHHLLYSVHPSPLSAHRGFFGCKHFSKTNELLLKQHKTPINWHSVM